MAILNIVKEGDPTLRKVCRPVTEITPRILTLLNDMRETLIEANGAGLAAPQVGILRRVVVIDVGDDNGLLELINPEIIAQEGEQEGSEGCLSAPGRRGYVKRPEKVTVRALDRKGKPFEVTGEGLLARAFCHEIDHLNGVLYSDVEEYEIIDDGEEEEQ
jgi:peptide deformylase